MASRRFRDSRAKPLAHLKRPRRRLGDKLRWVLSCPLCMGGRIKVVRWGEKTTRFECDTCGLRFSMDLEQLARVMREPRLDSFGEPVFDSITTWVPGEKQAMLGGADGAAWLGEFIEEARQVYPGGRYRWEGTDFDR